MTNRVSVVPWGNIEDPNAPRQFGLKVGKAYVCRGPEVVLFATRQEAATEAAALRARLAGVPAEPNHLQ